MYISVQGPRRIRDKKMDDDEVQGKTPQHGAKVIADQIRFA
jgi:hypothetical protein